MARVTSRRERHAGGSPGRRIGWQRRCDADDPGEFVGGNMGQCRHEQAEFADALPRGQEFDEATARPATTGSSASSAAKPEERPAARPMRGCRPPDIAARRTSASAGEEGIRSPSPPRMRPTAMPSMATSSLRVSTMIGSEVGFSATSSTTRAVAAQAFDRDLLLQAGDDDLAVARFRRAMYGEKVAVEDAGVDHREAAHAQQEIGLGREQVGIERIAAEHVLDGRIGLPAATELISGRPSCSTRRMPRGAGSSTMLPFLASA